MTDSNGFIDLRIGHGAQGVGDDSVWPSFTDVMTVIVMIFLMALVVIMVRNFELDRQLLATMSDSEATKALNQDLLKARMSLESSLEDSQNERNILRARLMEELKKITLLAEDQEQMEFQLYELTNLRLNLESANLKLVDENQQAKIEIGKLVKNEKQLNKRITLLSEQLSNLEIQSSEEITALSRDKRTMGEKLDTVSTQLLEVKLLLEQLQSENIDLSRTVSKLKQEKSGTDEQYSIAADEIRKLTALIKAREAENAALQAKSDSSSTQYRSLQDAYDALDEEYRKLIRPARSRAGKFIVKIWVEKNGSGYLYKIRTPDQSEAVDVDRDSLESTLAALKQEKGELLYTRIIIPEDSELSHNEAWEFTQDILQKYDYYYQQP